MKYLLAICVIGVFSQVATAEVPMDVQELVFAEQLPDAPGDFVYCLAVDGEDVTPSVIARLQRPNLSLAGASECTQIIDPEVGGSRHVASGRRAMFYRLNNFSQDEENGATVEFESYHHGLSAWGGTFLLQRESNVWRVTGMLRAWEA